MNTYSSNGFKLERKLTCKVDLLLYCTLHSPILTNILASFSLKDDYLEAVEGMRSKLLRRTSLSNLTYLGELENNGQTFKPKMVSFHFPLLFRCDKLWLL